MVTVINTTEAKYRCFVLSQPAVVFGEFYSPPCVFRGERRFEKPLRREGGRGGFEDGGTGRKDYNRSDSDNWRTLREELDEEEEGGGGGGGGEAGGSWRTAGTRRDGTHVRVNTHCYGTFGVCSVSDLLWCGSQTEARARPDGEITGTETGDAESSTSISGKATWRGGGQGAREGRRTETGCRSGALTKRRERWAPSIRLERSCVSR